MNENAAETKTEIEIDVQRLIGAVWNKKWTVVLAAVLGTVLALLVTLFLVTPKYECSTMFYVNNSALPVGDTSSSLTSSDITASKSLVESYIVVMQTRKSLMDVIEYADLDRDYNELRRMISASAVNSTEFFEVVVTSPDPVEAEKIANAIAHVLPQRIASIIEGTSVKVADPALAVSKPSSPSYISSALLGFVLGAMVAIGYIVLRETFDVTIRCQEDIAAVTSHPILTTVPDMEAPEKSGGYYGYGSKHSQKSGLPGAGKKPVLMGSEMSFAASEAYKLLRTRLQFSFADDNDCRVIGITSALSGEGKSLSSVNLAHSLSQLGEKVLLVDCDMRRPSLSVKLPISKTPGLSNFLSGQTGVENIFQNCGMKGEKSTFHVVAAGRNPPNPVELLSSARMGRLIGALRKSYNYIILDLPPLGEVSDALAVAKYTDGMLLVVRQNYGNRVSFGSAVRKLESVDVRILGIVENCADEDVDTYGRKYNKHYYQKYYGSSREAGAQRRKNPGRETEK